MPCLTLPPLDVDPNKKGVASDHKIIIFPPAKTKNTIVKREKQIVKIRPLPKLIMNECGKFIATHTWEDVYNCDNANKKAEIFHKFLTVTLDKFFPQKVVKKSPFDKKWFSPPSKLFTGKKQREFFKHRRSEKFIKLQKKFNSLKKINYSDEVPGSNPVIAVAVAVVVAVAVAEVSRFF